MNQNTRKRTLTELEGKSLMKLMQSKYHYLPINLYNCKKQVFQYILLLFSRLHESHYKLKLFIDKIDLSLFNYPIIQLSQFSILVELLYYKLIYLLFLHCYIFITLNEQITNFVLEMHHTI